MPLPRISIITPSFNHAQFIEETIRSILDQQYPSLEFIVIDGGSTDGTAEVLRRYQGALAYWSSEPDRGQADAVNRGFARATGDLVVWINSDDLLLPGSLAAFAAAHTRAPHDLLLGRIIVFDKNGYRKILRQRNVSFEGLVAPWMTDTHWLHAGMAVPRAAWARAGPLDESFRYVFDREWGCRLLKVAGVTYLDRDVAMFRLHEQSKTVLEARYWLPEDERVTARYIGETRFAGRADVMARLKLREAGNLLTSRSFDRPMAVRYARQAWQTHRPLVFSGTSAYFVFRVLMPRGFVVFAAAARQAWKNRTRH